ncbi:MAG: flagellar biosynthesis protein FlhA [Phycisphaerae bacterium]|nr:flagellar biosynthesis protein FlhA [Phycisphaerae bacterium]
MALNTVTQSAPIRFIEKHRGILFPIAAASLLLVILIPLPLWLMDMLLVANITVSALVLMTVMYMKNPVEFSVFPSVLLSLTLFRLVLNTATTRLILTNAQEGTAAAGKVIQTFGEFVAQGSLAIGLIIFVIIVVIQFVVITKGTTRIAEVAARFTLDGMPGKQMAIDADLNAGTIDEAEARRRREEISHEADFYGAMDGASKFVRGDAIAGIIITFVNVLGGIYVGKMEVEPPLAFMECVNVFTKLSIGDGLTAQIPAFIISISAAMLVTRSNAKSNLGEEILTQVASRPTALVLSAAFLGMLAFTPLPKVPLALLAGGCVGLAFLMNRTQTAAVVAAETEKAKAQARKPERVENFLAVDPMELEVGYGLIRLVDRKQGGDLLDRITNIRKQTATEYGFIVPPIRIRDQLRLEPNRYVVNIKGIEVGSGEVMPEHLLAIDSGLVSAPINGIETKEPAFGLPALWIAVSQRHDAEHRNYTVVEPTSVLATHLTEIIKQHAAELLTREQVGRLLDTLKEHSPKIVEDVIPESLKVGQLQKVLQNLLRERVPIRDLETILETLSDWAPRTKDLDVLTEYVRHALARAICSTHRDDEGVISAITFDPQVEDMVNSHLESNDHGTYLTLPPVTQNKLVAAIREQVEATAGSGAKTPVLLCSPQVRAWVRRLIESVMPHVAVLGYNEIVRGVEVRSRGMVVLSDEPANVPG